MGELEDAIAELRTRLEYEISRGNLDLSRAKEVFNQYMANYQFKNQRQQNVSDSFTNANKLVLEGSGWAMPDDMEYAPGYEPDGVMSEVSDIYGGDPNLKDKMTFKPKRIHFDPRGDVERAYRGGYDWADIPMTVGERFETPGGTPTTTKKTKGKG